MDNSAATTTYAATPDEQRFGEMKMSGNMDGLIDPTLEQPHYGTDHSTPAISNDHKDNEIAHLRRMITDLQHQNAFLVQENQHLDKWYRYTACQSNDAVMRYNQAQHQLMEMDAAAKKTLGIALTTVDRAACGSLLPPVAEGPHDSIRALIKQLADHAESQRQELLTLKYGSMYGTPETLGSGATRGQRLEDGGLSFHPKHPIEDTSSTGEQNSTPSAMSSVCVSSSESGHSDCWRPNTSDDLANTSKTSDDLSTVSVSPFGTTMEAIADSMANVLAIADVNNAV